MRDADRIQFTCDICGHLHATIPYSAPVVNGETLAPVYWILDLHIDFGAAQAFDICAECADLPLRQLRQILVDKLEAEKPQVKAPIMPPPPMNPDGLDQDFYRRAEAAQQINAMQERSST